MALLRGMQNRFGKELSFNCAISDKIVAAVSHPYFMLRWLPEDRKEQCRHLFVDAVKRLDERSRSTVNRERC